MESLLRAHSWVLAAGVVGAVMLKRPGAAKVLGAVALADVAGRQLSPGWAALIAGWYPTESAGAASVVAPLRTVEEVRARGINSVNAVAEPVLQSRGDAGHTGPTSCPPGQELMIGTSSASVPDGPRFLPDAWCQPKPAGVQSARTRTIHTLAGLLDL